MHFNVKLEQIQNELLGDIERRVAAEGITNQEITNKTIEKNLEEVNESACVTNENVLIAQQTMIYARMRNDTRCLIM